MKKILLFLVLGAFLSNLADIYCRVKFQLWLNNHRITQGMPETTDMFIMEFLSRPVYKMAQLNECWFK